MSSLSWYWHRLRAMSPAELGGHGRRKLHQVIDRLSSGRRFQTAEALPPGSSFPALPAPEKTPDLLRAALRKDAADIQQGRWIAFGFMELRVDHPPRWHKDYVAGVDLVTAKPALKLHHRLEGKADIKLIWEPNRWYSLVRLAQAAYLLKERAAAALCLYLLEDWVQKNPPYFGWNWVSGLESGLRLVQFAWLDALLSAALAGDTEGQRSFNERLARVRGRVLRPHLWFTWRDRSFGSSANNHLIGELSGLIVALTRWPDLERWATSRSTLQKLWEREVLTQFAPDGGNREQALNYHLFSWEFCWQTRLALLAAGCSVSPDVEERLQAAASYFVSVQAQEQPWDYGDSDSAYVTPLFADWRRATPEWRQWLENSDPSPAIRFWLGKPPPTLASPSPATPAGAWRVFPHSGMAVARVDHWFLRWDLSPLGYLATAGHGHCDALHLSVWYRGEPFLIDPGTGAYHADRPLRDYLASWDAHNGPHPADLKFPERRGAFLWSGQHETPHWEAHPDGALSAELKVPRGVMRRTIRRLKPGNGWQIDDQFDPAAAGATDPIEVFWQLAPEAKVHRAGARKFRIRLGSSAVFLEPGPAWNEVEPGPRPDPAPDDRHPLRGRCSSAFRRVETGPFVLLRAKASPDGGTPPGGNRATLRTIIRVADE